MATDYQTYTGILRRAVAGTPEEGDAAALTSLKSSLSLTDADVAEDTQTVRVSLTNETLYSEYTSALAFTLVKVPECGWRRTRVATEMRKRQAIRSDLFDSSDPPLLWTGDEE